ncbi:hypothetical protein JX265_011598 [Neoarthrinium moseri]|uniref:Uncharacterized protein n=1 Tax=Neoarthrinium moseri TaxID=1658444 RepID=A0A9P9WCG4_9PEZI|nr:hypothetical protein JX265_011598 [Neoarthrinium moseri]
MAGFVAYWAAAVAAIAAVLLPLTAAFPTHVCATNAPPQPDLPLNNSVLGVESRPWGLIYLNEKIAFAAVNFSIGVIDTSELTPKMKYMLPLPPWCLIGNTNITEDGYGLRGLALTNDKRNLYAATGYGAVILDVNRALAGRNDSYVGVLSKDGYVGQSAIEVTVSADDKFVFISQEFGSNNTWGLGALEVYNVTRLANGTVASTWRGFIALGYATIGQQFSQDHSRLFVTSEMNNSATSLNDTTGIVNVLDVATLRRTPGKSLVKKIVAGCHPVRAQMSLDGRHLWVTTRESNHVLAFDAAKLADNTTMDAQVAQINTGTSPIGITAIRGHILTADSNRFGYSNASTASAPVCTAENLASPGTKQPVPSPRGCLVSDLGLIQDPALQYTDNQLLQPQNNHDKLTVDVNFHIASTEAEADLITDTIVDA